MNNGATPYIIANEEAASNGQAYGSKGGDEERIVRRRFSVGQCWSNADARVLDHVY